ncbi:MAG: pilus assembly protein [Deltaproteobacteria bacterium]|nr:pilus assembly protein [Deltaproteobacteria bacterium]
MRKVPLSLARRREGSYAVIFAITLVVLLGFAAITIDVGYQRVVRNQLENITDASAHAGAHSLDGTNVGATAARTAAQLVASENHVADGVVTLDLNTGNAVNGDIVLGTWDFDAGEFVASADVSVVNTVQVRSNLELSTFFAQPAFGRAAMSAQAVSYAYKPVAEGAGEVTCFLPIAIADCMFDLYSEEELQSINLALNPAGVDNVGWARPDATPNASWVRSQIQNCQGDGALAVGDSVGLNNGVITSALSELGSAINSSSTTWDTAAWGTIPGQATRSDVSKSNYGKTLEGVIVIFDGGPDYCTGKGGSFNGSEVVSGFVFGAVYDVVNSGKASEKNISVRIDLSADRELGTKGGGRDAGVVYQPPVRILQ